MGIHWQMRLQKKLCRGEVGRRHGRVEIINGNVTFPGLDRWTEGGTGMSVGIDLDTQKFMVKWHLNNYKKEMIFEGDKIEMQMRGC